MGNIWTVARQTIAEGVRMRIALVFLLLLAVLLMGLPFVSKGDNSVSGAVQSFLTYSIISVAFLLSCLSVFLCKSISDDLEGKQILMLMTKPIARWQYVLGKWTGVMALNTVILILATAAIYGMTRYVASQPPRDQWDKERLANQILTARHANPFIVPDFTRDAEQQFEQNLEQGRYAEVPDLDRQAEIKKIKGRIEQRWRTVRPLEQRRFDFENVRCDRSPDKKIHIQYEARVYNYAPDEIIRCSWMAGDREKGAKSYIDYRRDVRDRKQTVTFPADTVADDETLTAWFNNVNPYIPMGEQQYPNTVVFEGKRPVEVLFSVSSFESNLVRAITLVWCRLAFLAAVGVLATCIFSFPVACLVSLVVYGMASSVGFLDEAVQFMSNDTMLETVFHAVVGNLLRGVFFMIPDFSKLDGLSVLVDGRNVTLKWVLMGLGQMVLIKTSILLLAACLIFGRRQVSEASV